jgi:methyl-accepting chemotaxis protein
VIASFLDRQSFSRKFALLGSAIGFVVATLIFQVASLAWQDISSSQDERDGLAHARALTPVVEALVSRRSGDTKGGTAEAVPALDRFAQSNAGPGARLGVETSGAALLKRSREALAGASVDPATYNTLIADWINYAQHVADVSKLTLDPEFATYYAQDILLVRLLPLIDFVGRTRAAAANVVTWGGESSDRVTLLQLVAGVDGALDNIKSEAARLEGLPGLDLQKVAESVAVAEQSRAAVRAAILRFALDDDNTTLRNVDADGRRIYDEAVRIMPPLFDALDAGLQKRIAARYREAGIALTVSVLLSLLVMVAFVVMSRRITRSAQEIGDASSLLAGGDCTVRVNITSQDELGAIGRRFNRTAEAFSQLVRLVQDRSAGVLSVAGELAAASAKVSAATRVESEATSAISAAIEEITSSLGETSNLTTQAQTIANQSGSLASSGEGIARGASAEIDQVADRVSHAAALVERLHERSVGIDAIVSTISGLAEQTNLLALNAAIEAARAGDAGRGFAVVADEVRTLAERTHGATREISAIVQAIQSEVQVAAEEIGRCSGAAQSTVGLASQVATALSAIQEAAANTRREVDSIEYAVREQSAASLDIAQRIARIAEMTEENSAGADRGAALAEDMRRLASQLREATANFKA